jgi:hypothetical protein
MTKHTAAKHSLSVLRAWYAEGGGSSAKRPEPFGAILDDVNSGQCPRSRRACSTRETFRSTPTIGTAVAICRIRTRRAIVIDV